MRTGYIAIIGAPNAGKSTLMNKLLGTKISIVSPKAQTTRMKMLGVLTEEQYQMIFVDTPGVFTGTKRRLDRAMVANAFDSAKDADVIVLLVDAEYQKISDDTQSIIEKLKSKKQKIILALNKIDAIDRQQLLPLTELYNATGVFSDVVMVSALKGDGLDQLKKLIKGNLPIHPFLYPPDYLTETPERLIAAEITREQLYMQLSQELPYATMVDPESFEEFKNGDVKISQSVIVARDSQKSIVLGNGGARVKSIREAAQKEMSRVLGRKVHLFLNVKVRENWDDTKENFRTWGLEYNS